MRVNTTDRFKKDIYYLKDRYPEIVTDIYFFYYELIENPRLGIPLSNSCYEVRLANLSKNINENCRSIIYHVDKDKNIYFISIYIKSEKNDISEVEFEKILTEIK